MFSNIFEGHALLFCFLIYFIILIWRSILLLTFISGFFAFLKSAVIVLGYIQGNSLFPEPLSSEEEKVANLFKLLNNSLEERKIINNKIMKISKFDQTYI